MKSRSTTSILCSFLYMNLGDDDHVIAGFAVRTAAAGASVVSLS